MIELELHQIDLRYEGLRRRAGQRERALLSSLSEFGQQVPVVVVGTESGGFALIDGYKRVRALRRLHRDTVLATAWQMAEPDALLLVRVMRTAESDSAFEHGWLLRELQQRFGLSSAELARRFDKSESWISRRLALVNELPESVQELVRRGELSGHGAMKHLVPLARAKLDDCLALAPVLAQHRISSRQIGTLCAAWAAGTAESRQVILKDPLLILRAEEEARRPKEQLPADKLIVELTAIAAIARRARRIISDLRSDLAESIEAELRDARAAAEAETSALFRAIRQRGSP